MTRPWIKQPTSKLNDARLSFVSDQAQRDYFMLYFLAGQLDADGLFFENGRRLSDKEIAFRIHVNDARLKKTFKELKTEGLIHINGKGPTISDWSHEQINWREKQAQDRDRQQRHRHVTRDSERVTLLDQKKKKTRPDKKKTRPDSTPTPPKRARHKLAGGDGKEKFDLSLIALPTQQRKRALLAMEILRSSGLRSPRLKNTAMTVATRRFKNTDEFKGYLLGALASSYADNDAKDKAIVAAYRIEKDEVPAHFKDPKEWTVIPPDILEIAKVSLPANGSSHWDTDKWSTK